MARAGRVARSAINSALENVRANSKVAKEVMDGASRSGTRASIMKNAVNTVKSNMSSGQTRVLNEAGQSAVNAVRREGMDAAVSQVKARTAEKAMNRSVYQGNQSVKDAVDLFKSNRTKKVIDGHNAQQRAVDFATITNNVKDARGVNLGGGRRVDTRRATQTAVENVRNSRINTPNTSTTNNSTGFNEWMNREGARPITRFDAPNSGPQASPFIHNRQAADVEQFRQDLKYNGREPIFGPSQEKANRINANTGGGRGETKEPTFNTGEGSTANTGGGSQQAESKGFNFNFNFGEKFDSFAGTAKDTLFGGTMDAYANIKNGGGIMESIAKAHKNDDGSINMRRAAGTFVAASAAARVASGGGLYKDRYGNPNLIGVPFI